jgi:hypothetical protein
MLVVRRIFAQIFLGNPITPTDIAGIPIVLCPNSTAFSRLKCVMKILRRDSHVRLNLLSTHSLKFSLSLLSPPLQIGATTCMICLEFVVPPLVTEISPFSTKFAYVNLINHE